MQTEERLACDDDSAYKNWWNDEEMKKKFSSEISECERENFNFLCEICEMNRVPMIRGVKSLISRVKLLTMINFLFWMS